MAQESEDERPLALRLRESLRRARGILQCQVRCRVAFLYLRHLVFQLTVFASHKRRAMPSYSDWPPSSAASLR